MFIVSDRALGRSYTEPAIRVPYMDLVFDLRLAKDLLREVDGIVQQASREGMPIDGCHCHRFKNRRCVWCVINLALKVVGGNG